MRRSSAPNLDTKAAAAAAASTAHRSIPTSISVALKSAARSAPPSSVSLFVGSWNMGAVDVTQSSSAAVARFLPCGHDVYVLGLQEAVGVGVGNTFLALAQHVLAALGCVRLNVTASVDGRGDGSFLHPKSTTIAVFVKADIAANVAVIRQCGASLGMTEGSKGGAAVALKVFDRTVLCVYPCTCLRERFLIGAAPSNFCSKRSETRAPM